MLLTYGYKKLSIAKNVYMNSGFQISSTKVCSNSNTMSVNKMYWIHWNIRFVVQYYNDNHYNTMFSPVSELILCVWTDLVQRFVCVCVCVYVCVHAHAHLCPFTMKASSVTNSWNVREQINNVVLKAFLFSTKSFDHYFRIKHKAFLISHFILFTY